MTRLEHLKRKGYSVIFCTSGCVFAVKNNRKTKGTSVSNLHIQIFGY